QETHNLLVAGSNPAGPILISPSRSSLDGLTLQSGKAGLGRVEVTGLDGLTLQSGKAGLGRVEVTSPVCWISCTAQSAWSLLCAVLQISQMIHDICAEAMFIKSCLN